MIPRLVKLRCMWGEVPEVGDGLVTRRGRMYLVAEVRGRTLRCLVINGHELEMPVPDRWHYWQWSTRRRRRSATAVA